MQLSRFSNRSFENAFLRLNVNKAGFYVDLCVFGDWRKQCFIVSTFRALGVIASLGQCHSCCPKHAFLKDLPSQKLLIVNLSARMLTRTEVHNLTDQVVCLAAELILLPKQNFKSLNSRRRLVPSEVRKYQSELLLPKSPYLYWILPRVIP